VIPADGLVITTEEAKKMETPTERDGLMPDKLEPK